MRNIDFHDIDDEMLRGDWTVQSRIVNRADPNSALARVARLRLEDGTLRLFAPPDEIAGRWSVARNDDLVRRPYLELELGSERSRALITRLRQSDDRRQGHLDLYTAGGIELSLVRR